MAHICYLPKGSCNRCKYYRKDEDRDRMACWADHDVTKLEPKTCSYIVTVTREDGTVVGEMEIDPEDVSWDGTGKEFASVVQTAAGATEEGN